MKLLQKYTRIKAIPYHIKFTSRYIAHQTHCRTPVNTISLVTAAYVYTTSVPNVPQQYRMSNDWQQQRSIFTSSFIMISLSKMTALLPSKCSCRTPPSASLVSGHNDAIMWTIINGITTGHWENGGLVQYYSLVPTMLPLHNKLGSYIQASNMQAHILSAQCLLSPFHMIRPYNFCCVKPHDS